MVEGPNHRIWSTKIFFTYTTCKYTLLCPPPQKKFQIDFWPVWVVFSRWVTYARRCPLLPTVRRHLSTENGALNFSFRRRDGGRGRKRDWMAVRRRGYVLVFKTSAGFRRNETCRYVRVIEFHYKDFRIREARIFRVRRRRRRENFPRYVRRPAGRGECVGGERKNRPIFRFTYFLSFSLGANKRHFTATHIYN